MRYLTSRWRALAVTETHAWAVLVAVASMLATATAQAAPCARYATPRRGPTGPSWHSYLHCETEADRPTINAEGDIAHSMAEGSLCVWTLGAWACLSGGGGANVVSVDVDFGTGKADARATVTGQAWVTASSKIVCVPTLFATATRADGAEDALIEGLRASVYARVAGTGFSVMASVARGFGYGVYNFSCTGA